MRIFYILIMLSIIACSAPDGPQGPKGIPGINGKNADTVLSGDQGPVGDKGADGQDGHLTTFTSEWIKPHWKTEVIKKLSHYETYLTSTFSSSEISTERLKKGSLKVFLQKKDSNNKILLQGLNNSNYNDFNFKNSNYNYSIEHWIEKDSVIKLGLLIWSPLNLESSDKKLDLVSKEEIMFKIFLIYE